MADRPPSKRWRVYGARGISNDHRSERAAYDHVQTILRSGVRATVFHWEDGRWIKFDVINPEPAPDAEEATP